MDRGRDQIRQRTAKIHGDKRQRACHSGSAAACRTQNTSSNDIGDITWVVPTGTCAFRRRAWSTSAPLDGGNYTDDVDCPQRRGGWGEGDGGVDPRFTDLARFASGGEKTISTRTRKISKYFSLLPPGAKPPLDLNREMMEKYRPAMRKFYLSKKADFKSVRNYVFQFG